MTLGRLQRQYVRVFDGFGRVLEGSREMLWMVEGWWLRI